MSGYYVMMRRARVVYNENFVMVKAKDPESAVRHAIDSKVAELMNTGLNVKGPVSDGTEIVKLERI